MDKETGTQAVATSLANMITGKQLGYVRALARELGVVADDECQRLFNCRLGELSKRAASDFIEHLQQMRNNVHG